MLFAQVEESGGARILSLRGACARFSRDGLATLVDADAPSIEELYSAGPHLASYAYEIGRPDLAAARGLVRDAGGVVLEVLNLESAAHDVAFNCVVVRDDARFETLASGIEGGAEGRYVQLIGTFDSSRPRPLRYAGVIKDLRVIRTLPYDP